MSSEPIPSGNWRIHLLISGGVFLTFLFALLLAQLDGLQQQILPSPIAVAIVNLNATPTNTPLPAIPLASGTLTAPNDNNLFENQNETAVSGSPNCDSVPLNWLLTPVEPSETLLTLSLRYNVSEETIRLANCLKPNTPLSAGMLYLPSLATLNAPIACGPPSYWVQYFVRPGQTMFFLAFSRGTTVAAVLNANCLQSTKLQAGQGIFLPRLVIIPATATSTATSTPTATATSTATSTSTNTATSTVPALPTSSATATVTQTSTPSATPTVTGTATVSATPTQSPTTTSTATVTATVSPTASATATPSPTNSATPTFTASPSSTPTATSTATSTPTETAVATATPSPTP
ncbi:MAG: LysM peptidoglycan-binding domain-containing protein [Chloroflexi bacterium]|nr:LysM peptidoglycan-binding domain-containing protein [Chloroflexota bacterium]